MYVIKRTDQGGGYLAAPGSRGSYTKFLQRARTFANRDDAERECCVDNEVIREIREELQSECGRF